ncbi:hypothetical protein DPMN_163252 [Dreissena polymorpha]|uniref:Uncharacterized protein n=1 Tax=Dreissena polymorpha TaxID=45954 RepID=A0A9D4IUE9_DREPO|nr:hypothetical protein DPMN_163252 [Dreissena polymorpha]
MTSRNRKGGCKQQCLTSYFERVGVLSDFNEAADHPFIKSHGVVDLFWRSLMSCSLQRDSLSTLSNAFS